MYSVAAFPKVCFLLGSGSKSLMASRITWCWRKWQISRPHQGASDAGSEVRVGANACIFLDFVVFISLQCRLSLVAA